MAKRHYERHGRQPHEVNPMLFSVLIFLLAMAAVVGLWAVMK